MNKMTKKPLTQILWRRNLVESLGENYDGITDKFSAGAMSGVKDFGLTNLNIDLYPAQECRMPIPNPEDYVRDAELMIDSFRQAWWNFYNEHPTVLSCYSLDLVPWQLRTDSGRIVRASSIQELDLETGEVKNPYKAGIILSRNAPIDLNERNATALGYLLTWHEFGHLPLGIRPCQDNGCIHSHPAEADRGRLIEEKAQRLIQEGYSPENLPVCQDCKGRLREFRRD